MITLDEPEFASARVAYAALADDLRRQVDGKVVVHSFGFSRSLIDPGIGTARSILRTLGHPLGVPGKGAGGRFQGQLLGGGRLPGG